MAVLAYLMAQNYKRHDCYYDRLTGLLSDMPTTILVYSSGEADLFA